MHASGNSTAGNKPVVDNSVVDNPAPKQDMAGWLHQFVDVLSEPAAIYSEQGELLHINPAFGKSLGWSIGELARDAAVFIPPSEAETSRRFLEEVLAGKAGQDLPTKRLTKSGQSLHMAWSVSLCHDEGGRLLGRVEIYRDLTDSLRKQKRLEILLQVATELPGLASLQDVLTYLSRIIKEHLRAESSSVMLLDRQKQEIYFQIVKPPSSEMEKRFEEVRFPADLGVAGHVVQTGEALFVPDLKKDRRFYEGVDRFTGFESRDLVYAPLKVDNVVTGVLGALNKKEGVFSSDDVDFMVMLAHTVALSVENARAREARQAAEKALEESLKEKEILLQEIHHRVKNNMQVIASMLGIQKMQITDPMAKRVFSQSQDRIRAMAMVHESVYQSGTFAEIQFNEYVRTLCNALYRSYCESPRKVKMLVQVEPARLGLDEAVPLGLVLNELVTNAFKHGFPDDAQGEVRIQGKVRSDGGLEVVVADSGVGFPKHLDIASASGLYMVRGLVEKQLKGSLELGSWEEDGRGANIRVHFPGQGR